MTVTALPAPIEDDRESHVLVARYRKARVLADMMVREGFTTLETESADDQTARALAAKLAGTRVPSQVTWALVVELVREARAS